jgi:CubicO group peptidase (beta-lactamase class C family)
VRENGRDFNPGITIPNGGWNAPLGDLARYVAFLTGAPVEVPSRGEPAPRGEAATRALYETIIPHRTLEAMWAPRFPVNPPDTAGEWMGLSFFVHTLPWGRVVGHTGSQAGFRSFFYWNPANRMAVITVVNTSNSVDNRASSAGFRQLIATGKDLLK